MKVKNDVRSRDGYNDVAGVHIIYEINQKMNEPVTSVRGIMTVNDERIGTLSMEKDGRMYVSIDKENNLSFAERSEVIATIITDMEGVFIEDESVV